MTSPSYGDEIGWQPARPRLRLLPVLASWAVAAASVYLGAALVPGVELDRPGAAIAIAAAVGVVNVVIPPLLASLRLPWTLAAGFLLVLFADAGALVLAEELLPDVISIGSFGDALLAAHPV
jgi:uncharacterized membrane protein YvlD (DUF360 family)